MRRTLRAFAGGAVLAIALCARPEAQSGCNAEPAYQYYGQGQAGAGGVPDLTLFGIPMVAQDLVLILGNPVGGPTRAALLFGREPGPARPFYGYEPLVDATHVVPVELLPGSTFLTFTVPPSACGVTSYVQLVVLDDTAPGNVAASRGLELRFGQ